MPGTRRSVVSCNKDGNHDAVVAALEGIGATVTDLAMVGNGCPDLLVGYQDHNYILEIKRDGKVKLNGNQEKFHATWLGRKPRVCYTPEMAVLQVLEEARKDTTG